MIYKRIIVLQRITSNILICYVRRQPLSLKLLKSQSDACASFPSANIHLPVFKLSPTNIKFTLSLVPQREYHYTGGAHYLPYREESEEEVENYDNITNCIDMLVQNIKRYPSAKNSRISTMYTDFIKPKPTYTPLVVHDDRRELLEDWNEIISIMTEMKVVPEEADQVRS